MLHFATFSNGQYYWYNDEGVFYQVEEIRISFFKSRITPGMVFALKIEKREKKWIYKI